MTDKIEKEQPYVFNPEEAGALSLLKLAIASGEVNEEIGDETRENIKAVAFDTVQLGLEIIARKGWPDRPTLAGIGFINKFKGNSLSALAITQAVEKGKTLDEIRGKKEVRDIFFVRIDPSREIEKDSNYVPEDYWNEVNNLVFEFAYKLGFLKQGELVNGGNPRLLWSPKTPSHLVAIPHMEKPLSMCFSYNKIYSSWNGFVITLPQRRQLPPVD